MPVWSNLTISDGLVYKNPFCIKKITAHVMSAVMCDLLEKLEF